MCGPHAARALALWSTLAVAACSGPPGGASGKPSGSSADEQGTGGTSSSSGGASASSAARELQSVDASNDAVPMGATVEDGGEVHRGDAAMSVAASLDGADALASEADASNRSDGAGPGLLVYPAFAADATIDGGLAQLNAYRTLAGLSAVALDSASSAGCATHLQYLICAAAAGGGNGYLEHTETGYPACATDGGAQAGVESDLAWGESESNRQVVGQSLGQAVDDWINSLYHRTPLLDPGLTKVGAASTQGYSCLDYGATGNTASVRVLSPVLFPPNGTTDVPENFVGNEDPCPTAPSDPLSAATCPDAGFIVTANWYGWGTAAGAAITAVSSAALTDTEIGAAVPLLTFYADNVSGHDPAPGYVHNEIALVPEASLAPNHTFSVTLDATISGQTTVVSWSFTTGSRVQSY
ncbi:MAG: CAP domain-containing protein [Polyangiaceae bacterium]|jgi:hypothetical protein